MTAGTDPREEAVLSALGAVGPWQVRTPFSHFVRKDCGM